MNSFREGLPVYDHDGRSWPMKMDHDVMVKCKSGVVFGPWPAAKLEWNWFIETVDPIIQYQIIPREKTAEELWQEKYEDTLTVIESIDCWSNVMVCKRAMLRIMELLQALQQKSL